MLIWVNRDLSGKKFCVLVGYQINVSPKDDLAADATPSTITQVKSPDKESNHLTELNIVQATLEVYVPCWALQFSQDPLFL